MGLCQQKLGALERDFATSATQAFVDPLKKFMESDLKVSNGVYPFIFNYILNMLSGSQY